MQHFSAIAYLKNEAHRSIQLLKLDDWKYEYTASNPTNPWYENSPKLIADGIALVPMGSTVLRRGIFSK